MLKLTSAAPLASKLMPDCCHDFCDDGAIYLPHRWRRGVAEYVCQQGHTWTCSWGHGSCGTVPENKGRPQR